MLEYNMKGLVEIHVYEEPNKKNSRRDIDIDKFAGSAKDVFGKGVDVDTYIKEMRSDERF